MLFLFFFLQHLKSSQVTHRALGHEFPIPVAGWKAALGLMGIICHSVKQLPTGDEAVIHWKKFSSCWEAEAYVSKDHWKSLHQPLSGHA